MLLHLYRSAYSLDHASSLALQINARGSASRVNSHALQRLVLIVTSPTTAEPPYVEVSYLLYYNITTTTLFHAYTFLPTWLTSVLMRFRSGVPRSISRHQIIIISSSPVAATVVAEARQRRRRKQCDMSICTKCFQFSVFHSTPFCVLFVRFVVFFFFYRLGRSKRFVGASSV